VVAFSSRPELPDEDVSDDAQNARGKVIHFAESNRFYQSQNHDVRAKTLQYAFFIFQILAKGIPAVIAP
jgi:hypothetical protein